ncbi:MAG: alkyl hydroperoxide reductase [Flavobacteriales bacterium]|jgi:thiol-disulfide isomerase/thioredoxin|nr:alkyl hydroperoxide reductase [Flavobacteriales bacterium]|tara:strand:+ start:43 stop:540 length:498 start_codon:yes stop_codon:yes gene_type:complete
MKKILFVFVVFILNLNISFGQERELPNINVKTLSGKKFNISNLQNNGNPIVISFWATWCKPCKKELNNIAEIYNEWQDETGVKIVAISIDDSRSKAKVAPYVNSSDWEYEVYLDQNGDLKRAMGVSSIPHTFLLNKNNEIVWQHKGYVDGDEYKLLKEIKKLQNK